MTYGERGHRVRNPCMICGCREGTIRTRDGPVCPDCMPREFLEDALRIGRDRIMLHNRLHTDWESCAGLTAEKVDTGSVSGDRSMAITQNDSVVLADELNARIRTSDTVDMVVSFIKMSGINLIIDSLREFSRHGRLRVITTAYMGATEYGALAELFCLPNTEVRMEMDAEFSRLHAKTFLFGGKDGGTAYVGSANISRTALTSGEEWVVKLREQDVPPVLEDLRAGFDSLWCSGHYEPVSANDRARIEAALEKRGL